MARESCYFADDFSEEVRALADPATLAEKSIVMQFPFTAVVSAVVSSRYQLRKADPIVAHPSRQVNEEKSAEEIARTAEKRKESGRRLQEIQQKARLEKVRALLPLSLVRSPRH